MTTDSPAWSPSMFRAASLEDFIEAIEGIETVEVSGDHLVFLYVLFDHIRDLRRQVAELTGNQMSNGTLHVMDRTGDTKIMWSSDNPDEVEAAKATFDSLKKKKFLAYTVREDGEKGEVIRDFDKTAERIIMAPQLVGG